MGIYVGDALANSLDSFADANGANADLIQGLAGNDSLVSYAGNDTLDGGDDDDDLQAGDGADYLYGGNGNDLLLGDFYLELPLSLASRNDYLDGGAGNDTLDGGAGADSLFGGTGDDLIYGDYFNDDLIGIGNESIDGGDGNDFIYVTEGNNILQGGTGADTIQGGSGNDTIDGGAGIDTLWGGDGDDTYLISDRNDAIYDFSGTDTAIVSVSGLKIPEGIENVQYINGAQPLAYYLDALYTGLRWGQFEQPVTLTYGFLSQATAGATESGATGFQGMEEPQRVLVRQALANWSAVSGLKFIENTTPITNANASAVDLRFGMNSQPGTAGYAFYPPHGDIYIDYNDGINLGTISHEIGHALGLKHPFGVAPFLPTAEDTKQYTLMSYTLPDNAEFLEITATESGFTGNYYDIIPDTPMLYDVAAIQYLYGANGDTEAGNNTYTFDPDIPFFRTLWDGGGVDAISVANFTSDSVIDLRDGHFSSIRVLPDIPDPLWGWPQPTYDGNDNLAIAYGSIIENAVGGSGADTLIGNDAGNWLDGGAGADSMLGGLGNDTYVVSVGADSITEGAGEGLDAVRSMVTLALGANLETLVLLGTGHIDGAGNGGNNIVSGNAGNNLLDGGAGADIIAGGAGNDTYVVDHGGDQVMELGNSGIDGIQSAVAYDLMRAWHVENLTLTGGSGINGAGNWLDNLMTGNGAANLLDGSRGNDTLDGGLGNDTLIGGDGNDALIWDAADGSVQGGAGVDTLLLQGGNVLLNLAGIDDLLIANIEVINLAGSGNNILTLGLGDVLAISSTTDLLWVDGDGGDTVNAGGGWTNAGQQSLNSQDYNIYTLSSATLLIDTDITSIIV